jgi:hypothetical protein
MGLKYKIMYSLVIVLFYKKISNNNQSYINYIYKEIKNILKI